MPPFKKIRASITIKKLKQVYVFREKDRFILPFIKDFAKKLRYFR